MFAYQERDNLKRIKVSAVAPKSSHSPQKVLAPPPLCLARDVWTIRAVSGPRKPLSTYPLGMAQSSERKMRVTCLSRRPVAFIQSIRAQSFNMGHSRQKKMPSRTFLFRFLRE